MGEIGIDEVVSAMGMIIQCFSEHIQPHAAAIAHKVRENVVGISYSDSRFPNSSHWYLPFFTLRPDT